MFNHENLCRDRQVNFTVNIIPEQKEKYECKKDMGEYIMTDDEITLPAIELNNNNKRSLV